MRLILLTLLTMLAFAGNSLLNRLALLGEHIGPAEFAGIRVVSGALVLLLILTSRNRSIPRFTPPQLSAVAGLSIYMVCFSFAYVAMDAGLGAIILFGFVQLTMFTGALIEGEKPAISRWIGMVVAFAGVVFLSLPGESASYTITAAGLMTCAAVGWGWYSLKGRNVTDPLASTFWNFLYSVPIIVLVVLLLPTDGWPSFYGITLAILSGGVTSAIGYALWYSLIPSLGATRSALAQLSVPVITLFLSVSFLGESLNLMVAISSALVLSGIAIGLVPARSKKSGTQ